MELKTKGNEYFKAKQFDEAIEQYSQAVMLDSKFFDCYSNRAASYINLKQYDKALEDGERCITLDSTSAKGHWRKGDALQGLRRWDDAIKAYTQGAKHATESEKVKLQVEIERCTKMKTPPTARAPPRATQRSLVRDACVPLHLAVVGTALVGLAPTDFSFDAFYWCLKFSMILNLILLIQTIREQRHFPHFQPEGPGLLAKAKVYAMLVAMSNEFHYITTAGLFLTSRPFFLCNLPQAIRSVQAICQFFITTLPSNPLSAVASKVLRQDLDSFCASLEVLIGFVLLIELLLPTRNFLICIMYWQFMRARYMTEMQKPYSTKFLVNAFGMVKEQLDGMFLQSRFIPTIVGKGYSKAQSVLANMVDPVQASQSKCSVM